jgi:hypothetical protein
VVLVGRGEDVDVLLKVVLRDVQLVERDVDLEILLGESEVLVELWRERRRVAEVSFRLLRADDEILTSRFS